MGLEIEKKFLVDQEQWNNLDKPEGAQYRQGYLLTDPHKTIRVRQTPDKGFLTIKGLNVGAARPEYEYEIPHEEAGELLDRFVQAELSKIRYNIVFDKHTWEVDVFSGANEGLIVAEIELEAEDEQFALPGWIGAEVTGQEQYYNANLSMHPFKNWAI